MCANDVSVPKTVTVTQHPLTKNVIIDTPSGSVYLTPQEATTVLHKLMDLFGYGGF